MSVLLLMVILLFFVPVLIFFMVWHDIRSKQAKEKWVMEQEKLREASQERELRRISHAAQVAAEDAAKCEILAGYLLERQACYEKAVFSTAVYANIALSRRQTPEERSKHIVWESLKIIFESKNTKTVESRATVIRDNLLALGYSAAPIGEHDLKIMATHCYMMQILTLQEKIDQYKTNPPKEKAKLKISTLIEQAFKDEMVYHNAFEEFCQPYSNQL